MAEQIELRPVERNDIAVFYEHECDPVAVQMAAFTAEDPTDREACYAHWDRVLANEAIRARTVLCDGEVVGHVAAFDMEGQREVTYWIGQTHWGRGVATAALRALLAEEPTRPIYAHVAADNLASQRVLAKCGFRVVDEQRGYANARGCEIDELVVERTD